MKPRVKEAFAAFFALFCQAQRAFGSSDSVTRAFLPLPSKLSGSVHPAAGRLIIGTTFCYSSSASLHSGQAPGIPLSHPLSLPLDSCSTSPESLFLLPGISETAGPANEAVPESRDPEA